MGKCSWIPTDWKQELAPRSHGSLEGGRCLIGNLSSKLGFENYSQVFRSPESDAVCGSHRGPMLSVPEGSPVGLKDKGFC